MSSDKQAKYEMIIERGAGEPQSAEEMGMAGISEEWASQVLGDAEKGLVTIRVRNDH